MRTSSAAKGDQLRRGRSGLQREGFRTVHVLDSPDAVSGAVVTRTRIYNDLRHESGPFDVIGDIHGCRTELETLLTDLGYTVTRDERHRAVGVRAGLLRAGQAVSRQPRRSPRFVPAGNGRSRHHRCDGQPGHRDDLPEAIGVREENAAAALEVMSRFATDPRWLLYLPPTMSPVATSTRPDLLEHPSRRSRPSARTGWTPSSARRSTWARAQSPWSAAT